MVSVWKVEEHVDLLVLYKNMLLSGIKKDNFKELSKRMAEVGWDRNNDQCRQQVCQTLMLRLHLAGTNKLLLLGLVKILCHSYRYTYFKTSMTG